MALTQVKLKENVFITLDDAKDWCKIPLTNTEHDTRMSRLINMVTDMCEKYIDGPIKDREYVEFHDGDSSNVIVPDHYPIREVVSMHIDVNRNFDEVSKISTENYILRGIPDHNGNIKGVDIALRDDNNASIFGRIWTGSVAGAIKLQYRAGWGKDQDQLPADIVQAILMGVEYFYKLRDNSELGVRSKTNNNQGYSRDAGLPPEVTDILDSYKDWTLGINNVPQKNNFSI